MTAPTRATLVAAYWECDRLAHGDRADRLRSDDLWWAWEAVDEAVASADPDVVDLLCALADSAPDEAALARLGAGPVENLLARHGDRFVSAVDEAARRNERFRVALQCAWYEESLPAELADRLRRFGEPL